MLSDEEELISLTSKYSDESISEEEMARLNELLRQEDLRRAFLEISNIHFALKSGTLSASDQSLALKIAAVHDAILPNRDDPPLQRMRAPAKTHHSGALIRPSSDTVGRSRTVRPGRRMMFAAAAAAAAVVIAFVASRPSDRRIVSLPDKAGGHVAAEGHAAQPDPNVTKPTTDSKGFVARVLAATKDVTWQPGGAPRDFLMRFEPNSRIKLATGLLKIQFSGGAEIVLHAPADFEIIAADEARLHVGNLSGESDSGSFSLLTPAAKVIDVGTQFGVSVDARHNTGVSVFDGEVHVRPVQFAASKDSMLRLTQGMSAQVDSQGVVRSDFEIDASSFPRLPAHEASATLGASEVSLIDVISGSGINEYRLAGSIDPATGYWGQPPWEETKGVERRTGHGQFIAAWGNPLVDGVFVPGVADEPIQIDSGGHTVRLGATTGATWGPIWARRRLDDALDPLGSVREEDVQGFWGVGTIAAMRERLTWSRDGLVGMHSNVGITLDLYAIREQYGHSVRRLRGIVTHLERFHESNPLYPQVRADFRVYVDGEPRYARRGFRRSDGDAQFGVSFSGDDRFLTLVSTDCDGSNTFDHVILIDPIIELVAD